MPGWIGGPLPQPSGCHQFLKRLGPSARLLAVSLEQRLQVLDLIVHLQTPEVVEGILAQGGIVGAVVELLPEEAGGLPVAALGGNLRRHDFHPCICVGMLRAFQEGLRRQLVVFQAAVVHKSQVVPETPVVGVVLNPFLQQFDGQVGAARPGGRQLGKEDGAVAVGQQQLRVEAGGDVQQVVQELVALRPQALPAIVLHGAGPVETRQQTVVPQGQAFHPLSRGEVQHLLLHAEVLQACVHPLLDAHQGIAGHQDHDQNQRKPALG